MADTPCQIAFLTAEWRDLVIANFEVEPPRLAPLVPTGTELDLCDGRALVSLVAFRFQRTRVLGVPIPWHVNFTEVNLRFYVRRRGPDGTWRRAVTFIRELVPRRAIALTARWIYGEPYVAVPMRHRIASDAAGGDDRHGRHTAYSWRHGPRWHTIGAVVRGAPRLAEPGSEAEFTIEHYWGYTTTRGGLTREYEVAHPPWRVWHGEALTNVTLDLDPGVVYGNAWADLLERPPTAVLVAEGSPVRVYLRRRLRPSE